MLASTVRGRYGSIAALTGFALLVNAARSSTRTRGRPAAQVLIGSALLGVGLRQRRSGAGGPPVGDRGMAGQDAGEKAVSDDATAARERHDVMHQNETNPRGVSDEPEVETTTGADEGDVRFTEEGDDPRPKPDLDDEDPADPRYNGESEEDVEIDLSEATMADEASEATGPAPEQSQPAQVEDTEPDSSPPEDTSHVQADVPDKTDVDSDTDAVGDEQADDEMTDTEPMGTNVDDDGEEPDDEDEGAA